MSQSFVVSLDQLHGSVKHKILSFELMFVHEVKKFDFVYNVCFHLLLVIYSV